MIQTLLMLIFTAFGTVQAFAVSPEGQVSIIETNVVTDTHIRPISEIKTFYKLTVGSAARSEDLFVTGEHPFWVTDKQEWIIVDDIEVGAKLTNHQGEALTLQAKIKQTELQQTYNITVAWNNNYFAGHLETLVHNCSVNHLNQQILRGQAPRGLGRIDIGKTTGEQTHIVVGNGNALNIDGTWKHGGTQLTNAQKEWLTNNGWTLPE